MTGCVAENCANSSSKGVKMCSFPSDPVRRAVWVTNVGRQNWFPNKCSALCEYHFGIDAFEKVRVDGTKKLRSNAIPTIFGELVIQIPNQQRKTGNKSCSEKTGVATCCMINDSSVPTHEYQEFVSSDIFHERHIPVKEQSITISVQKSVDAVHKGSEENHYLQEERNTSTATTIVNTCTEENSLTNKQVLQLRQGHANDNTEIIKLKAKCKKFEQLYKKGEKSKIIMKRMYTRKQMALKRRIKTLEQQVKQTTAESMLQLYTSCRENLDAPKHFLIDF